MPTLVHIENRYCSDEAVVGAAITFDGDEPEPAPNGLHTRPGGNIEVPFEKLDDGQHIMTITPDNTSDLPVGPQVAENLPNAVRRTYRSLDVDITVKNGQLTTVSVPADRQENGSAGPGISQVQIRLQPIFFRGSGDLTAAGVRGSRKYEDISVIVIHQTAGRGGETTNEVHGTLAWFRSHGSPHYLVTAEAQPKVIKIVPDNHVAGHASDGVVKTWWRGKSDVDSFSIGIEDTHQTNTPWSKAQIDRLIRLLKDLRSAYPSIPPDGIVGHQDVLSNHERDCPGLDFDWVLLEKEGLGIIPRTGSVSLDFVYGGFFRLRPNGQLQLNDNDTGRVWGGNPTQPWPSSPGAAAGRAVGGATKVVGQNVGTIVGEVVETVVTEVATGQLPTTVIGNPIRELQTDLRDIGYNVTVNGVFDDQTRYWVKVFQDHFFAGSRRSLLAKTPRGKAVDRVTAEFIKSVRP